ncbi:energy-coupling factor ABC transporter permease, partial [Planctomycetota bacterium]
QCLIFQDGGLLALGCNLINLALVPTYTGHLLYRLLVTRRPGKTGTWMGTMIASLFTVELAAILVVLQTGLSGVVTIPLRTFLVVLLGVHFVIGMLEGILTVAIIGYLQEVRPDLFARTQPGSSRISLSTLLVSLMGAALILAGLVSLWASERPDGLEWSYAERPDQPNFRPIITNEDPAVAGAEKIQARWSLWPGYTRRTVQLGQTEDSSAPTSPGWTSVAGIVGALLTMASVWMCATLMRRRTSYT